MYIHYPHIYINLNASQTRYMYLYIRIQNSLPLRFLIPFPGFDIQFRAQPRHGLKKRTGHSSNGCIEIRLQNSEWWCSKHNYNVRTHILVHNMVLLYRTVVYISLSRGRGDWWVSYLAGWCDPLALPPLFEAEFREKRSVSAPCQFKLCLIK